MKFFQSLRFCKIPHNPHLFTVKLDLLLSISIFLIYTKLIKFQIVNYFSFILFKINIFYLFYCFFHSIYPSYMALMANNLSIRLRPTPSKNLLVLLFLYQLDICASYFSYNYIIIFYTCIFVSLFKISFYPFFFYTLNISFSSPLGD